MEEVYAIIAGDELTSLKDAKNSPNWPEWEIAIQAELDLLKEKGTWKLVEKPPDAIPIANKWVFIKKRDKEGKVIRYRARLVEFISTIKTFTILIQKKKMRIIFLLWKKFMQLLLETN